MVEVIVGGAMMLVGGVVGAVVQHLLQRMRNKDARQARREDILYDKISAKQLEAFEDAVRVLYLMNSKWIDLVESSTKIWRLGKTEVEGEEAQRERMETLRALSVEDCAMIDDFEGILDKSQETIAMIGAYLPSETVEAFIKCCRKSTENLKWVEGLEREGGVEKDFKLAKEILVNELESAVASLREHMDIKDSLANRDN